MKDVTTRRPRKRSGLVIGCTPLVAVLSLYAQTAVPSEFQAVNAELSAQVANSTLTQGWNGSKYPVSFGGEVSPASGYINIVQAGYYRQSVTPFLNAMQTLGDVKVAKVNIHFPLLYIPFYAG